ncbi:hypothetical protein ASD07_03550 [Duganella sp. Root336D2]|nr:hypothetical protein ASD07_03550 [Duganella sp. Root336D2]
MDGLDPAPFMRTLRHRERRFGLAVETRRRNPLGIRQHGQVFQTQINTNSLIERTNRRFGNFDHNIEEPVAPAVLRKTGAILDLALRQRPRVEHTEGMSRKAKRIAFPVQVAPLQGYPAQSSTPTVTQIRSTVLPSGFGVLFANSIDVAGMQSKFFAAALRQIVQSKPVSQGRQNRRASFCRSLQ